MTTLTDSQLAELRRRLLDEQDDINRRLSAGEHYGLASSLRDDTGELSPIDNHPGDVATEVYERGKDIALLEQEDLHLSRIDAALKAMDNGTYGNCKACGKPIPLERLEALPDTLYCVEHAPRQETSHVQPAEESLLNPPFGRSSMDQQSSYNGFDGEDAWQIVEQWGNADSPAFSENRDVTDYGHMGIENDENDGFVEPLESFVATDITGRRVSVIRNREYMHYMHNGEGDHGLEFEDPYDDDDYRT
ncbi:TraR/DksA C4-type zinc finger protein [Paenibacillus arenilitoris]|uniref:TraR/DksA C4-type zinc finger protein n=1 Tax=Paenibacillus arenilitoris TaxID=2772299 RepID=A0A927H6Z5_9BACL|nr:TraR/DksA C4-type zinc finger protein [Paenibacillus arenilitoris]MBD2870108.1 TraR/DksA C4-type zinc finger protein [Paenibacillus arenilitoris]